MRRMEAGDGSAAGNAGPGGAARGEVAVGRPLAMAAPTGVALDALPEPGRVLTATELGRMARFRRWRDRQDFLAAHVLARACAGRFAGVPADRLTLVQRCSRCGGEDHGRPRLRELPGLNLSISHTAGYVAAIAGWSRVGVDVEGAGGGAIRLDEGLAALSLTPSEWRQVKAAPDRSQAFVRLWVRKEALVKLGELSLDSLATADLSQLPSGAAAGAAAGRLRRWRGLYLLDWSDAGMGTLGAAAADHPPRLRKLDVGRPRPWSARVT